MRRLSRVIRRPTRAGRRRVERVSILRHVIPPGSGFLDAERRMRNQHPTGNRGGERTHMERLRCAAGRATSTAVSCTTCPIGRCVNPRGKRTLQRRDSVGLLRDDAGLAHENVEPLPTSLSTSSSPPRSLTISSVSASPGKEARTKSASAILKRARARTDTSAGRRARSAFDAMESAQEA